MAAQVADFHIPGGAAEYTDSLARWRAGIDPVPQSAIARLNGLPCACAARTAGPKSVLVVVLLFLVITAVVVAVFLFTFISSDSWKAISRSARFLNARGRLRRA